MPDRIGRQHYDDDRARRRLLCVHAADGQFPCRPGFRGWETSRRNVAALHTVRVDGRYYRIHAFAHLRILPDVKKGLWGAINRVFDVKYPEGSSDGSTAYPSVDNAAMLRGFAGAPRWSKHQIRAQLPCASLAGPQIGRPATLRDAPRIVEILNATHEHDEMYLPYTVDSFTARVERAARLLLGTIADRR